MPLPARPGAVYDGFLGTFPGSRRAENLRASDFRVRSLWTATRTNRARRFRPAGVIVRRFPCERAIKTPKNLIGIEKQKRKYRPRTWRKGFEKSNRTTFSTVYNTEEIATVAKAISYIHSAGSGLWRHVIEKYITSHIPVLFLLANRAIRKRKYGIRDTSMKRSLLA